MSTLFTIGSVAKRLEVETYVIRYWLTEFPQIKDKRNLKGYRVFDLTDIALLSVVKKMLREDRLTIKGTRQRLDRLLQPKPESELKFQK